MNWLNNLYTVKKMFILTFFTSVIILGIGILGIFNQQEQVKSLESVYNDRVIPLKQLKVISDKYAVDIVDATHKVRNGNISWGEGLSNIENALKIISEQWTQYTATKLTDEEKVLVRGVEEKFNQAVNPINELQSILRARNVEQLDVFVKNSLYLYIDPITTKISELIDLQLNVAKTEFEAGYENYKYDRNLNIVIIIIGLLGSVLLSVKVTKNINQPLTNLKNAANEVSMGNTQITLKVDYNDDIGELTKSFNHMVENIRTANKNLIDEKAGVEKKVAEAVEESEKQKKYLENSVEDILKAMDRFAEGDLTVKVKSEKNDDIGKLFDGFNRVVANIGNIIKEVSEAVQATASASNQISASAEEMAAGSEQQTAQVTEVASAVEEMTSTIIENTRNITKAAEKAKDAGEIANDGGKIVNETVTGMNKIAEVVSNAGITVDKLGKSSDQIGEIVQVINDIADQTNLLALNAAIEAARAGEQGRGFAVVADEVRKLAERTSKATREIGEMIKQIQIDTKGAVESMEKGRSEVENGKQLAARAGDSLEEIIRAATELFDLVSQVATASEEQSSTAESISRSIEGMSNVIHESSTGTQQVARATEDLNRLTENLQLLIDGFNLGNSYSGIKKY